MLQGREVEKYATLAGHADAVYTVIGGLDEDSVISSGGDGMVALWDLKNPDIGKLIAQVPASVYAMALDRTSKLLAVGHNFDGVHLIDLSTNTEVKSVSFTQVQIFSLLIANNHLYAASADGVLTELSWPELEVKNQWKLADKSLRKLAYNPESQLLAVGASDEHITVFDLQSRTVKKRWKAHESSVFALAFMPEARQLVSGSRDAMLKSWDVDHGFSLIKQVPAHNYAINDVVVSPCQRFLATVSMDKSTKIWDAKSLKLLKVIDKARHAGHATSVNAVYWSPFSNLLVTASDDRKLAVWSLPIELLEQRAQAV